jgi:hypothetical protein
MLIESKSEPQNNNRPLDAVFIRHEASCNEGKVPYETRKVSTFSRNARYT